MESDIISLWFSLNFFYVQPALCAANISLLPCVTENPVDEALFNFVNAYSLMLGGLMFADPQARGVSNKMPLYIGTMVGPISTLHSVYGALNLLNSATDDAIITICPPNLT